MEKCRVAVRFVRAPVRLLTFGEQVLPPRPSALQTGIFSSPAPGGHNPCEGKEVLMEKMVASLGDLRGTAERHALGRHLIAEIWTEHPHL
ncbi:hypothetical protein D6833_08640, partial [Candidatus Parcubacteria bacterium]